MEYQNAELSLHMAKGLKYFPSHLLVPFSSRFHSPFCELSGNRELYVYIVFLFHTNEM